MSELLIEIYSEEIPARMQIKALEDFKKIFSEFFNKQNIAFREEDLKTFITPRRLVLLVKNLVNEQISPAINKIGPAINAPNQAIEGFLKSVGLKNIADLQKIDRPNGQYYFYKQPEVKIKTAEILTNNLPILLQKMAGTWTKSMDLIDLKAQSNWVRPIRNILAIFASKNLNSEILNFEFANLKANNQSFGHLLMGKKSFQVLDFADYRQKLEENFVILDWFKRREIIVNEINKINSNLVELNAKLIDEITGLNEFPQVLIGKIDDNFSSLPSDVLQLTIKIHQKAILFENFSNGKKSLNFIFVSNIFAKELATKRIISDNEKVVHARLSDAKFYLEEDLKIAFNQRIEKLKDVIFHKKLGSIATKIYRLKTINKLIGAQFDKADLSKMEKLVNLAKNDLTTKTVAELPELQGIIGGYLAEIQGEDKEICRAIEEQYLPVGQNSDLPKTALGMVLAMSDKIDNICSLFLVGEKPTSSKDPLALRRAALGIIRIILENKILINLEKIINKAVNNHSNKALKKIYSNNNDNQIKALKKQTVLEVSQFLIERNKFYLREKFNLKPEIINHIFADKIKIYCPFSISQKAIIINDFAVDGNNSKIIDLYKRVANILLIEETKDKKQYQGKILTNQLESDYEKTLYSKAKFVHSLLKKSLKNNDFKQALETLLQIEFAVKSFFDNLEVNCFNERQRENRLIILSKVRNLFHLCDFHKISF